MSRAPSQPQKWMCLFVLKNRHECPNTPKVNQQYSVWCRWNWGGSSVIPENKRLALIKNIKDFK